MDGLPSSACGDNLTEVRSLLKAGVHPDQESEGYTALFWAVYQGNLEMTKLLLEFKADVNKTGSPDGSTPLETAIKRNKPDIINLLSFYSPNITNDILAKTIRTNQFSLLQKMYHDYDLGLNDMGGMNGVDRYGCTFMTLAVCTGNKEMVRFIFDRVMKVTSEDLKGAIKCGHLEIAEFLLDCSLDIIDGEDAEGNTALMYAAQEGHKKIVDLLISRQANVEKRNGDNKTALTLAQEKDHKSIVKTLQKEEWKLINRNPWKKLDDNSVACITVYPDIAQQITAIFNFKAQERTVFSKDLETKENTLTQPQSFNSINNNVLKEALEVFQAQGGEVDGKLTFSRMSKQKKNFFPVKKEGSLKNNN